MNRCLQFVGPPCALLKELWSPHSPHLLPLLVSSPLYLIAHAPRYSAVLGVHRAGRVHAQCFKKLVARIQTLFSWFLNKCLSLSLLYHLPIIGFIPRCGTFCQFPELILPWFSLSLSEAHSELLLVADAAFLDSSWIVYLNYALWTKAEESTGSLAKQLREWFRR